VAIFCFDILTQLPSVIGIPLWTGNRCFDLALSEVSRTPAVSIGRGYPAPKSGLSCAKVGVILRQIYFL
jgi:hypothetical protein